jgi:hypothetical protein
MKEECRPEAGRPGGCRPEARRKEECRPGQCTLGRWSSWWRWQEWW